VREGRNIYHSTQFFMLIPNMLFLLYKSWIIMEKFENYVQNSEFFQRTEFPHGTKKISKNGPYTFEEEHLTSLFM
jgi:hypothetical protein